MTTDKQTQANRANAQSSTGPKTAEGKAVVAMNAITHGILSTRLLLTDESADIYGRLRDSLEHSLKPVGMLELALVEKIAVALWKQRRMVAAEAASIELARAKKPDAFLADLSMITGQRSTAAEAALEAERVNTKQAAPWGSELMVRYQIALDGELYRAAEALRRQQEFRLKLGIEIEGEVVS